MNPTFEAAVLERAARPLSISRLEAPDLLHGQVLVRLDFSGVCRSQVMEARGLRGADQWLPHLLGHEGSGVVAGVGPAVTKVGVGDKVILGWVKGDGIDAPGPRYARAGGVVNAGPVTTFSEFSIVAENRVYRRPPGVEGPASVLYGCALLTGAGMALNQARLGPTDSVLVLGLGGVGMSALVGALASGPAVIYAADPSAARRSLALSLGAQQVFDPSDADFVDTVHALTHGGVDVCLEAGGTVHSIELGYSCVRDFGGRLIFASHPPSGDVIRLDPHDLIRGREIHGTWGGASVPDRDIPRIAEAVAACGIDLALLLDAAYPLASVNEALDDLEVGKVLRPYLDLRDPGACDG